MVLMAEAILLEQRHYCAAIGNDETLHDGGLGQISTPEHMIPGTCAMPSSEATSPNSGQHLAALPKRMASTDAPAGVEHVATPVTTAGQLLSGMLSNGLGGQVFGDLCNTANLSEEQAQLVLLMLQQRAQSMPDPPHGTMQHPQQQEQQPMNGHVYDSSAPPSSLEPLLSPWQQQQHQQQMLHSILGISGAPASGTPSWLQQLQGPAADTAMLPFWSAGTDAPAGGTMLGSAAEQLSPSSMDSSQLFSSIAAMFDPPGSAAPAASKPATWASVVGGLELQREGSGGIEAETGEELALGQQGERDASKMNASAQVAVHNVPFKWCHSELEQLFSGHPGFVDAVLLFHDNGRSKGVGVALFENRDDAIAAVAALTGRRVDGRQLELTLLSEDNHISFDTRQVCVLGLPWEYSARDVRALLEGAGHVERVEVLYRNDGKSEGRALAAFQTRDGARRAVLRLNNRETLAGLHLKLFFVQEPARGRRPRASHTGSHAPDSPSSSTQSLGPLGSPRPYRQQQDPPTSPGSTAGLPLGGEGGGSGTHLVPGSIVESPMGSPSSDDKGPTILHVSGLPEGVTREELRALFSTAGEVTKVDIPNGGRNLGYGFITFSSSAAAEQAMLQLNNYPLAGGAIHVAYSTSATARVRQQALQQARARAATMAASPQKSPHIRQVPHTAAFPITPLQAALPRRSLDSSLTSPTGSMGLGRSAMQTNRSLDSTAGAAAASYAAQLAAAAGGLGFGARMPAGGMGEGLAAGPPVPPDAGMMHASRQLYVSGLPPDLPEEQLHALFAAAGPVEYARKPRNRDYGFVRFVSFESASLAVRSFNGATLPTGERLRVEYSTSFLQRNRHGQTPHLPGGTIDTSGLDAGTAAAAVALQQQLQLAQAQQRWQAGVPPPPAGAEAGLPGWMMARPPTPGQRAGEMDAARGLLSSGAMGGAAAGLGGAGGGMAAGGMGAAGAMGAGFPGMSEADASFLAGLTSPGGAAAGRPWSFGGGAGMPFQGREAGQQLPSGLLGLAAGAPMGGMGANLTGGLGLGGGLGLYGSGSIGLGLSGSGGSGGLLPPGCLSPPPRGAQGPWGLPGAGGMGNYASLLQSISASTAFSSLSSPGAGYAGMAVGVGAPWQVPQPPHQQQQQQQQEEGQGQQQQQEHEGVVARSSDAQVGRGDAGAGTAAAGGASAGAAGASSEGAAMSDMRSQLPESLLPDIM